MTPEQAAMQIAGKHRVQDYQGRHHISPALGEFAIQQLAEYKRVLKDVATELQIITQDETCDHDVGICVCGIRRSLEQAWEILK